MKKTEYKNRFGEICNIIATINDGYFGKTADLDVIVPEDKDGKIYLTNHKDVYYWSGAVVNDEFKGTNKIAIPLRHYVAGLEVIMNVNVTKRHDDQFPVGIVSRHGTEKFTLKAAEELRLKLGEAIKWAHSMDEIRKLNTPVE